MRVYILLFHVDFEMVNHKPCEIYIKKIITSLTMPYFSSLAFLFLPPYFHFETNIPLFLTVCANMQCLSGGN